MLDRLNDIMHAAMLMFCFSTAFYFFFKNREEQLPHRVRHAFATILEVFMLQSAFWYVMSFTGHWWLDYKEIIMLNLTVVPFFALFFMELTRACAVTFFKAAWRIGVSVTLFVVYLVLKRTASPLVANIFYYLAISAILIYVACATVYFFKAGKRYTRKIADNYADLEGRTIYWLWPVLRLIIILMALVVGLDLISYGHFGELAAHILLFPFCIIILGTIAWKVDQMQLVEAVQYVEDADSEQEEIEEQAAEEKKVVDNLSEEQVEFMKQLDKVCIDGKLYGQQGITREDVSKAMNTNHIRLTRMLKEVTGLTFSGYISKIRIEQAARMLHETNDTVEQIFYSCGYRTRSTFNRAFTEAYGCTPKEYRNRQ